MTSRSRTTRVVVTAVISAGAFLLMSSASWAADLGTREGEDRGAGLSAAGTLALFVILPVLGLVVIGALAWLPNLKSGARYRPTRGWNAPPVWFGGPADPVAALEAGAAADEQRGGAHGSW